MWNAMGERTIAQRLSTAKPHNVAKWIVIAIIETRMPSSALDILRSVR